MAIPRDKIVNEIFEKVYGRRGVKPSISHLDFEEEPKLTMIEVASRFARGNVNLQNGVIVDEDYSRELQDRVSKILVELSSRRRGK